ncbi:N-acetylmuramoyl-L-alanine amidase [Peribacillus sp. SCS-37]|uniref:N-acetylmuramoyl-L-alanine amidase n=1 Tax=Paraperibacillus esterisolvens TaxID=3115296 RepID=UPI003906CC5F
MMKIMLDAGHGYNTPGQRSPDGMKEYEFNRAVALQARSMLLNYQGVTVYFAHSDKNDVPLIQRTDFANSLAVDVYVSIHANAFGNGSDWTEAEGIETFVHPSRPAEALELAQKVQALLAAKTGLSDRGVKTADFHVLRESSMTAILLEAGFMTNKEEIKLLRSEFYRKTVAEAIVKALVQQYKLKHKESASESLTKTSEQSSPGLPDHSEPSVLYRVQAGAFKDRKQAEKLAARLKKAGYEAFIF